MNIPTPLADELKLYLKRQADKGDLEAKTLLAQIELVVTSPPATVLQAMYETPPDNLKLGC